MMPFGWEIFAVEDNAPGSFPPVKNASEAS
jgi:hypothetical protein